VIDLLCHWISEKNPEIEERSLAFRKTTLIVSVVKKLSRLSVVSFLHLLQCDDSLWRLYMPHVGGFINLKTLPFILLQVMYDLGGSEGRAKLIEIVLRARQTIGSPKQGAILENLKVDTVIELLEELPDMEVRMRLTFSTPEAVAFWLNHWDLKMKRTDQPLKSEFWLGQLPGERGYKIEKMLRDLEFRRKFDPVEDMYQYMGKWKDFLEKPVPAKKEQSG